MRLWSALWVTMAVACGGPGDDGTELGTEPDPDTETVPTEPVELPTVIEDAQTGDPGIGSIDSIAFAPAGHLVVGDGANDRLVIVATGDVVADDTADDWETIDDLDSVVAAAMGAATADVFIIDIAVNPLSGRTVVAAVRDDVLAYALFTVQADGTVQLLDLAQLEWVAVSYPERDGVGSEVTDVDTTDRWIVAAARELAFSSSQVVTLPIPVRHDDTAAVTSTNTYHRSHRQWETRAPITTLFAHTDADGNDWVGASYQCAPVVRFSIEALAAGDAETVGVTPFDYGAGRQVNDFVDLGEGDASRILAPVYGLGGTKVSAELFLTTGEDVDESAPVVFSSLRESDHDLADTAPRLDTALKVAVLDAERLVRYESSGLMDIVNAPE